MNINTTATLVTVNPQGLKFNFTNETFYQIQEKYSSFISIPNEHQFWFLRNVRKIHYPKLHDKLFKFFLHESSVIIVVDMRKYYCSDNSISPKYDYNFSVMGYQTSSKSMSLPVNLCFTV